MPIRRKPVVQKQLIWSMILYIWYFWSKNPVANDPNTPIIIVTPPIPEISVLLNPRGSKRTLKTDPNPTKTPSNIIKTISRNRKFLLTMTCFRTKHMPVNYFFFKLTRLGGLDGSDLIASAKMTVIIEMNISWVQIIWSILCFISAGGLYLVTPLHSSPVYKNASKLPAGTESAQIAMAKSLSESGNHLLQIWVIEHT